MLHSKIRKPGSILWKEIRARVHNILAGIDKKMRRRKPEYPLNLTIPDLALIHCSTDQWLYSVYCNLRNKLTALTTFGDFRGFRGDQQAKSEKEAGQIPVRLTVFRWNRLFDYLVGPMGFEF